MTKEITTTPGYILAGLFVVFFIAAACFFVKAADHMIKTPEGARPERKTMMHLHPFGLFISDYFTDDGNHHRKLLGEYALKFFMAFLAGCGTAYLALLYG